MIDTRRKGRLLELVLVYAAIQVALWTDGTVKAIAIAAVWIGVFGPVLAERVSARKLGFGCDGLRASLWIMPAALHGLAGEPLWRRVAAYIPWAFAQQFAAQCFFFRRLETLRGNGVTTVLMTSLLFAGAHLPNPVLVPATLLAELLWTLAYRRYRNLYAISIAHALLAVAVAVAVPEAWHHHMRAGIGYLRYQAR
jgi:membrane protease YdiL (CAAX protease family)